MLSTLPKEIASCLLTDFSFPKSLLYTTVSTVEGVKPTQRTMRVYGVDAKERLVLLTHTQSTKWKQLQQNRCISLCFVTENKSIQLLIEGVVEIEEGSLEETAYFWSLIREDVKKIYDPRYPIGQFYHEHDKEFITPKTPPSTLGVIRVRPLFCELLLLQGEYTQNERYHFTYENGWTKARVYVG